MANVVGHSPIVRFHGAIPEYLTNDEGTIRDLERCRVDSLFFAERFLEDTFYKKTDHQKKQVWDAVDDDALPFVAILGRRGLGKTQIFQAWATQQICFHKMPFLMWVGSANKEAADETEKLKAELSDNKAIEGVFGSMLTRGEGNAKTSVGRESWALHDPTTDEVISYVLPKGANQGMRGVGARIGGIRRRVTDIIADDIDGDDYDVLNELTLRKTRRWFYGTLLNCVDPDYQPPTIGPSAGKWIRSPEVGWRPPWRVRVASNYRADDALIHHLLEDSDYVGLKLPLVTKREDGLYYSECPDVVSHEDVRIRIAHAKDNPDKWPEFCHDFLLTAAENDGTNYWSNVVFQYYKETEEYLSSATHLIRIIVGDPTKTSKRRSDPAALLAIAIDLQAGKIYLREYLQLVGEKAKPTGYTDELIALAGRTNSWIFAVELADQDDWIRDKITTVLEERGYLGRIIWVDLDTSAGATKMQGDFGPGPLSIKKRRAASGAQQYGAVLPSHPQGHVWHSPRLKNSSLEMAERACPGNKVWCGTDCVGYIPQIKTKLGLYFADQTPRQEDEINKFRKAREERKRYFERRIGVI